jgi:hypothetical protein
MWKILQSSKFPHQHSQKNIFPWVLHGRISVRADALNLPIQRAVKNHATKLRALRVIFSTTVGWRSSRACQ